MAGYTKIQAQDASISDLLKNLRAHIDPLQQDKSDTKSIPVTVDPVNLSSEDFSTMLDDFSAVFSNMAEKKYIRGGFYNDDTKTQLNTVHPANKIDAIWLYFVLSNYTLHWGAEKGVEMPAKIEAIKRFERNHLKAISAILLDVENNFPTLKNTSIRDHQRLLMIQGYLQMFIRRQFNGTTPEKILSQIPISFPHKLIQGSQNVVVQRTTGNGSMIEQKVNDILYNTLIKATVPSTFKPLKKSPNESYIDKSTSFELDFPLNGHITIETDGSNYHTHTSGRHDMVHTFKSAILRQSDWVRVPFSPAEEGSSGPFTNTAMLHRITNLLQTPALHKFHSKYTELLELRRKIINDINHFQNTTLFKRTQLSTEQRVYLETLVALDNDIDFFISERHLESLLREPIPIYNFHPNDSLKFKNDLIKIKDKLNSLNEKSSRHYNQLMAKIDEQKKNEKAFDILKQNQKNIYVQISEKEEEYQKEKSRSERYNQIYQKTPNKNSQEAIGILKFLNTLEKQTLPHILNQINELSHQAVEADNSLSKMESFLKFDSNDISDTENSISQSTKLARDEEHQMTEICKSVLPIKKLEELITRGRKTMENLKKSADKTHPSETRHQNKSHKNPVIFQESGHKRSRNDTGKNDEQEARKKHKTTHKRH